MIAAIGLHVAGCDAPQTTTISSAILGTAASFTVLAGTTVTNANATTVVGDLGVSPGNAVVGFPPGVVTDGTIHAADAVAAQAQADVTVAYDELAGLPCPSGSDLSSQDLGGLTLVPGVYCFSTSAFLTGTLTLDALGDPDAVFVFQIGSTLITASDARVALIHSAQACNVYWQVGSSATLGTDAVFVGSVLALTSITLESRVAVFGRALARNGAVTMDDNHLEVGTCATGMDAGTASMVDASMVDASMVDAGPPLEEDAGPAPGEDGGIGPIDGGQPPRDGGPATDGGVNACCVGVECGADCVDLDSDRSNCGACGNACAPSELCGAGTCSGCPTVCGGACTDAANDRNHCGACGNACAPSEYCFGGACNPCGFLCGGGCADLLFDRNNCGVCGNTCPSSTQVCSSGACVGCPAGTTFCSGACVELSVDERNCGACGTTCDLGATCVEGGCVCL